MSTKSLQIRNAAIALLTGTLLPGINTTASIAPQGVYTDWHYAIKAIDTPCAVVEMGDELPPQRVMIGAEDRSMQLRVFVIGAQDDAATAVDAIVAEVHKRLVADFTLGGLAMDMKPGAITRQRDNTMDKPALVTEMAYQVEYRTTMTSMEV